MEEYFEILKNAGIFKGIEKNEMGEMLSCLGARKEKYKKNDFVLREGSTVKSLGLLLTGEILVIQEDFWGNRNIIAVLGRGQCFGETFACAPGSVLNVSVIAREDAEVLFLDVQQLADFLSVERSGLSAELGKMQREGLLEYQQNRFALQRQIYTLNAPDGE